MKPVRVSHLSTTPVTICDREYRTGSTKSSPRDTETSAVQTRERSLEALHLGQHVLLGNFDIFHEDLLHGKSVVSVMSIHQVFDSE